MAEREAPHDPVLRIAAVAELVLAVGTGVIGLRPATNVSGPGPSPSVTPSPAPSDSGPLPGLVTEQAGLGVSRIIRDDFGHDLDARHPINKYDLDAMTVADDGTVWLSTSYNGTDNDVNADGPHLWALGRPGMLGSSDGYQGAAFLLPLPDGSLLLVGHGEEGIIRFDGTAFLPDAATIARPVRGGATLWLIRPDRLMTLLADEASVQRPYVDLAVIDSGDGWVTLSDSARRVRANGWYCEATAVGLACQDLNGEPRRYLAGTPIHQIASAPDGSVWGDRWWQSVPRLGRRVGRLTGLGRGRGQVAPGRPGTRAGDLSHSPFTPGTARWSSAASPPGPPAGRGCRWVRVAGPSGPGSTRCTARA